MKLIKDQKITLQELREMSKRMFGNLVKCVVDIEKQTMLVDAELHADQEAWFLEQGSKQQNLWGINIYPDLEGDDMIEFDSMINLRPSFGNKSRGVDDPALQVQIIQIVHKLVQK